MAARTARRATYEDLLKVPDNMVAEIIEGELYASPRPGPRHSHAASRLGMILGQPFDLGENGPGGWMILDEPELHLGDDVLVPDLAGWRIETMPALPPVAYFSVRPDWVCEVLSSSNPRLDRIKKMPIYARYGVGHAWIVDPVLQTLEVRRLENGHWTEIATFSGAETVRAEPFDAIEIDLSRLWGNVAS